MVKRNVILGGSLGVAGGEEAGGHGRSRSLAPRPDARVPKRTDRLDIFYHLNLTDRLLVISAAVFCVSAATFSYNCVAFILILIFLLSGWDALAIVAAVPVLPP